MGGLYIPDVNLPRDENFELWISIKKDGSFTYNVSGKWRNGKQKVVQSQNMERLKRRIVYRGDIFNALESARIIALDGILTDRYKDGFHDGLKRALEILANEVQDIPTEECEQEPMGES